MRKGILYLFLFGLNNLSFATTCTALFTDKWSNSAAWSCTPAPPVCGDTIIIPAGITITVDGNYDLASGACSAKPTCIIISGTLYFTNNNSLALATGSAVYIENGGTLSSQNHGSNTFITINGTTAWTGNSQGSTTNVSGGVVSVSGGGIIQPIQLLYFSATPDGEKIDLNWETVTETNNAYFTIEKSKDGVNFTKFLDIKGADNSTIYRNYTETDFEPLTGISYYRLKQTDFNGNYKYFNAVSVNFNNSQQSITAFPNPIDNKTSLKVKTNGFNNQEVILVIRDLQGREFLSKVLLSTENNQVFLVDEIQSLTSGIYIITASSNSKIYNSKLIVK